MALLSTYLSNWAELIYEELKIPVTPTMIEFVKVFILMY
jgi:hypothetical protein